MNCANQSDHLICRLILFRNSGSQVLVIPTAPIFCLPEVEIPRRKRVAYSVTLAAKSEFDVETIYLFPIQDRQSDRSDLPSYHAMEIAPAGNVPGDMQWISVDGLHKGYFSSNDEYDSIQLARIQAARRESFSYFGWFPELRSWVQETIRPLGLQLNHSYLQFNGGPMFSLIRFETDGPAVWFKAVGEPNLKEFAITQTLAGLFPAYVPRVVGIHHDSNGWLSLEAEGVNLAEVDEPAGWEMAASSLAGLQTHSIEHRQTFLDAGACDLSLPVLTQLVTPFFAAVGELMKQQAKLTPKPLTADELNVLRHQIEEALSSLFAFKLPDGLGHLDPNPGNIIVAQNGCIFLDWAEAYVGNPFLSFSYLLEHSRRTLAANAGLEGRIERAYLATWRKYISSETLNEVDRLAPLVAVFAYAVSIWNKSGIQKPRVAAYLRALTRRMQLEADQVTNRGGLCRA